MYDILLGMNSEMFNQLLTSLFCKPKIREKLFQGRAHFSGIDIRWSMDRAPSVSLEEVSPDQWNTAIGKDGGPPRPADNAFLTHITRLSIDPIRSDFSADVICRAYMADNKLQIEALGALVDFSAMSDFDREIFKSLMIPALLRNLSELLSGGYIPPLQYEGLRFGNTQLALRNGMICFFAFLEQAEPPRLDGDVPNRPVLLRLSPNTLNTLAGRFSGELVGKEIELSGKKDFEIGKAGYSCGVRINEARATVDGDRAFLRAEVNAAPWAKAFVKLLFLPVDIGYTGSVSPSMIPLRLQLFFENTTLHARVCDVGDFEIALKPSGNLSSQILSGIAWPLAQIMVLSLASSLKDLFRGRRFSLITIDAQKFTICGETIALIPRELSLRGNDQFLEIIGQLEI